jgi:arylsulfatase A-like enzyme
VVERTLFWRIDRADRKQHAVRHGRWKYLKDGGIEQLFDLERDRGERTDLSYREPAKLVELRALLPPWEREMNRAAAAFSMNRGVGVPPATAPPRR